MRVLFTEKHVIKSWCDDPEDGAIEQAKNLANLPFLFKHVALMSDTHQGYGMPIGGVIATKGVVIPNAVGVDIGCGMAAVKTSLTEISTERLKEVMSLIHKRVPVGFNHQSKKQTLPENNFNEFSVKGLPVWSKEFNSAHYQVGTLGGGNHFIEIQKGDDGHIWFMIHSGSRNTGKKVCDYYNKIAKELNSKWHSCVPKDHDLAFLSLDTEEARLYLSEMNLCLEFAHANRQHMIQRIKDSFIDYPCPSCNGAGGKAGQKCGFCDEGLGNLKYTVKFLEEINIHHNYAQMENHFGSNVMIHRKGATSAKEGQLGIIPGSQGTSSYIVKGKGNPDSFMSCSHGAGRKMGRRAACLNLNLEEEKARLDSMGVLHSIRNKDDLEEAPSAYKNIDIVMEEQKNLVDIVVKLSPLGVIKG